MTPILATWLDQLFGLTDVSWSDARTSLAFEHPLDAWVWVLIVLAALGFAGWSYNRLFGSKAVRFMLAGARALVMLFVVLLLTGPTLVRHDEEVEQDWLLVLVDRSASMQVRDVSLPRQPIDQPASLSREEVLRTALSEQLDVFSEEGLGKQRHIAWYGFGEQLTEIGPPTAEGDPAAWAEPTDGATRLRSAVEQALQRAAGKPISGIVLMTDGRSPQPTGTELIRRLEQNAVSVFAVPLGAERMPLDITVAQVDAPTTAFVNDIIPVTVRVDRLGAEGEALSGDVTVQLVDVVTDDVLDEREVPIESLGEPVRLTARSASVGASRWRVSVKYDAARELMDTNNHRELSVDIIDRPIRVLYIEGYPRWEYRYLKNMLIREKSIESSILLVSADRDFAQEGDRPITRPPVDSEELEPYDVIILGDVPSNFLSAKQIALFRDHIATRGAGLIWVGGDRAVPGGYAGTALADLLPMASADAVSRVPVAAEGWRLTPTPLANALNVLQLRGPGGADTAGWPDELPPLWWAQDVGELKPTVEVLATTHAVSDAEDTAVTDALPAVMRLRYGAGQTLYVATDETWRWRYGRGELYFEQFWIQMVRLLGRERVQQVGERARLSLSHRRVDLGETVVVELELTDPSLVARDLRGVAVSVSRATAPGEAAPESADTREALDQITLRREASAAGPEDGNARRATYRATWQAAHAGPLKLDITEPALADLGLTDHLEVVAPDDEWRQPQSDHARLVRLAEQTGGEVLSVTDLGWLNDLVPNRARRTPNDVRESLWDSALSLVILTLLLTVEWVSRKVIRLI